MNKVLSIFISLIISLLLFNCTSKIKIEEQVLNQNWLIASAKNINADAKTISSETINLDKWTKTSVPTTVLGALVDAGVYKDPFMGNNLEKIPRKPFEDSWWFRNSFDIEDFDEAKEHLSLLIDGVNYRANFWLNGKQRCSFALSKPTISKLFLNHQVSSKGFLGIFSRLFPIKGSL